MGFLILELHAISDLVKHKDLFGSPVYDGSFVVGWAGWGRRGGAEGVGGGRDKGQIFPRLLLVKILKFGGNFDMDRAVERKVMDYKVPRRS